MNQNFQKDKVVTGKTLSFVIGSFCTHHSICLLASLAAGMVVLYGNDPFSILMLSTKKRYYNFLKKVFVFQKICFNAKVLNTLKISADCHIKHADLSNEGLFLKSLVTFFRRTYDLSVGLKMKPLKKTFSRVKTKPNPNFAVKLAVRSNYSFLLSS